MFQDGERLAQEGFDYSILWSMCHNIERLMVYSKQKELKSRE